MKIGVDLDNTVGKYLEVFCRHANELYGKSISVADMTSPDVKFESIGLLEEEQVQHLKSIDQARKTFATMPMYEDAKETLNELCQLADIYFISCRDNYDSKLMHKHTRNWLNDNGIHGYLDIIFTKNKHSVSASLSLDYFVEDNLPEATKVMDHVNLVFLLSRPWNRNSVLPTKIVRMNSWHGIRDFIRKH